MTAASAPIGPEAFFAVPRASSFALSPDGEWLAWFAGAGERPALYAGRRADVESGRTDRATLLVDASTCGCFAFEWKDDTRILLTGDKAGNECYHVYCVALRQDSAPTVRDLTPFDNVQARVLSVLRGDESAVLIADNRRVPQCFDAYRVDLATGEVTMVAENPGDVVQWFADSSGRVRLAQAVDTVTRLRYRSTESEPFREIASAADGETLQPVVFLPDRPDTLLVLSNRGRDTLALYEFDAERGVEGRCFYGRDDVDVGGIVWSRSRDVLVGASYTTWRLFYHFFDETRRQLFDALERALPDQQIVLKSASDDERFFVVGAASDVRVEHHYLYCADSGKRVPLGSALPHLSAAALAPTRAFRCEAREGFAMDCYWTAHAGDTPLPLVVFPHGGPWTRDVWGFNRIVQWLANLGYAVLQMNFRGSTGYGKRFWQAGFGEWGGGIQCDIDAVVDHVCAMGWADPARIGIFGISFGGYCALMQTVRHPTRYRAAVSHCGTTDLVAFVESFPASWAPMRAMLHRWIGDPTHEAGRARLVEMSPITHVGAIRTPVFLAHGANDPRLSLAETVRMREALERQGGTVECMICDDEGHGFVQPRNMVAFCRRVERFLATHMG